MPGFLPFSRASFMLDVVAMAMVAVVPVMLWSIYLVKYRRQYDLHRRVQTLLGSVLLVAVVLFEVDIRLHGWRHLAQESPYYRTLVNPVLAVHLFFAISTTLLWIYTLAHALRRFARPTLPNEHSRHHRMVARLAAIGMGCTALTGWTFYWLAFVA
jgi:uncharacterized membrane protein YozB (DUF420 family)